MADEQDSPTLYRDRPEWADIKPIYSNDSEDAAVKIAATEQFIDAYAYLRAIFTASEMSERAFELTTTCIQLNPANYTVWEYRRRLLKALDMSVEDELKFTEDIAIENPKNYQVWHHRKTLVGWTRDPSAELEFSASNLQDDSKNYHTWQYRQWVVDEFDLYSNEELDFAMEHLLADLRNNSAWNYRYFLLANLSKGFANTEMVEKEITFVLQCIKRIPGNESAWSYLAGILSMCDGGGLSTNEQVNEFCAGLLAQNDPPCKSPHLRNFLVDCLVEKIEQGSQADSIKAHVEEAHRLLNELEELDPVRRKYWLYRRNFIDNMVMIKP